jgi:hypothetical protein
VKRWSDPAAAATFRTRVPAEGVLSPGERMHLEQEADRQAVARMAAVDGLIADRLDIAPETASELDAYIASIDRDAYAQSLTDTVDAYVASIDTTPRAAA